MGSGGMAETRRALDQGEGAVARLWGRRCRGRVTFRGADRFRVAAGKRQIADRLRQERRDRLVLRQRGGPRSARARHARESARRLPGRRRAWDIPMNYRERAPKRPRLHATEIVRDGPRAALCHTYRIGNSTLRQEVVLLAGSRRVDFVTTVDWRESGKMLRTSFVPARSEERR